MILQEKLEVKIGSHQYKYYTSLGYNVCVGESCLIDNKDILDGSSVLENRKCDICGKEYTKKHCGHIRTYKRFNNDVCPDCTRSNEQIQKITKERRADTLLKHYGVDNPSKSAVITQKKKETTCRHFGVDNPMQSKTIQDKAIATNIQKYGVRFPAQSTEIKMKTKLTCLEKYGVEHTSQIPESRIKANESYYKHGSQKTSSQQIAIFNMLSDAKYEVELNYPLESLSLDIFINYKETKIDIEYDGDHWHQDGQKDRRRDEFVKSQGYKILRIRSDRLVPTLEEIIKELDNLVNSAKSFHEIKLYKPK